MKALLIDTDRKVREIEVENTLKALQAHVGGDIAYDAFCGPVVVCRAAGDEFTDIQPDDEGLMRSRLYVLPAVLRGVAVG